MSQSPPTDVPHGTAEHGTTVPPTYPQGRTPVPMTPADETSWATLGHLSWLLGAVVGVPVLSTLVVYLVLRERGPFVRHHTAQALAFQLSLLIYASVGALAAVLLVVASAGLLLPVVGLAALGLVAAAIALPVVAAVAAARGRWYRYPLTLPLVR